MALTREQLKQSLINNITDALTRQNTAEVVRDQLDLIIDNCFNLAEDNFQDIDLDSIFEFDEDGSITSFTMMSQSGNYRFKITIDDSGEFQKEQL